MYPKNIFLQISFTAVSILGFSNANAQCTAILSAPGTCATQTITVSVNKPTSKIVWKNNGTIVSTVNSTWNSSGSTVAGGNGNGSNANQLAQPSGIAIDANRNIYIADKNNNRIQKWAPGATTGTTVAGGNGSGNAANQLKDPVGVAVDASGNIYICDNGNNRIQKWAPGATTGTTVAGGNGNGNAANQLDQPVAICLDASNNIYIADYNNDRIQKWASGATTGTTVSSGLSEPRGVFVSADGYLYVADAGNSRIVRFASGSTTGTTVAGSASNNGSAANQLDKPYNMYVDALGNIYIADYNNNRIQKWESGASTGSTVAAGNGSGSGTNQVNGPVGITQDTSGNLYVVDLSNRRVQKYEATIVKTYSAAAGVYTATTSSFSGCTVTSSSLEIANTPSISNVATTSPSSCNGNNGVITLSGLTSSVSYTVNFNKDNVAQSAQIITANASGQVLVTGLSIGSYGSFIVSRAGCSSSATGSVTISNPPAPSLGGLTGTSPTTCFGTDGYFTIGSMTANTTYTVNYKKNDVAQTPVNLTANGSGVITVPNLGAGSYSAVSVTLNGCTSSTGGPVTISNPPAPSLGGLGSTAATSCGTASGTLTISSMTANSPYTVNYSYNGVAATPYLATASASGIITVYSLAPGTYSNINVTKSGCVSSNGGPITISDAPTTSIGSATGTNPSSCAGTTGSIAIGSLVANTSYIVNYSKNGVAQSATSFTTNGSGVGTIANLGAGSYTNINVARVNYCASSYTNSVTLTDPAAPAISSVSGVNPTTCNGVNGSVTLNGLAANATYSVAFNKNGIAQSAQNVTTNGSGVGSITGLSSAVYSSIIATRNGCSSNTAGPVTLTGAPIFTVAGTNPTTCVGTNGKLTLSSLLANTSYTVNYKRNGVAQSAQAISSNASGVLTINNLTSGTYSELILTLSGCSSSAQSPVTLSDPAAPAISSTATANPTSCSGSNGTITLNGLTANTTYTVNFSKNSVTQSAQNITSNASGTAIITGLSAGTYSNINVTINNCVSANVGPLTLSDPAAPSVTAGNGGSVCAGSAISLTATTISGATYSWSGPSGFTSTTQNPSISNATTAKAGVYSVTATANGCTSAVSTTTVVVNTATAALSVSAGSACAGSSTTVTFTGTPNAVVTYTINAGTNQTVTLNNAGTASVNTGALSANTVYALVSVQSGSCTFSLNSNISIIVTPNTWNGSVDSNWNNAANWCGGVPTATSPVIIPTTSIQPVISGGTTITNTNFSVASGVTVTVNTGSTLIVTNDATINGSVKGAGTVKMNGTTAQTISGIGNIQNLEINNTAGVTITSTDTLKVTGTLTLTSGQLNTNNVIVLTSNSQGTACIGPITGGTINGNVIMERYIPAGKRLYRFFSHPYRDTVALNPELTSQIDVTGFGGAANGFTATQTNNASAFWYNPLTGNTNPGGNGNDPGWTAFTSANATSGANGWKPYEGIRVLVRGSKGQGLAGQTYTPDSSKLRMFGRINTGTINIPIVKGTNSGYNVLGNPYPSAVNLGPIMYSAYQSGLFTGSAYYVWDASAGTTGAYITQHINSASDYYNLPAGGAFVVNAAVNGTIAFHETDKVTTGVNLFKTTNVANDVEFNITSNNDSIYWDRMFVSFNDQATAAKENFDGGKSKNPIVNFYTLSDDNQQLAVDARSFTNNMTIPVGFKTTETNKYKIKVANMNLAANQALYLMDSYANTVTTLQPGTEYEFDVTEDSASQGNNRFSLNGAIANPASTTGVTTTASNTTADFNFTVAPNPAVNNTTVTIHTTDKAATTVSVSNISGLEVFATSVTNNSVQIPLSNLPAGIYMVKVTCGNKVATQRLVKE